MKHTLGKSALSLIVIVIFALALVQGPASCLIDLTVKQETARAFLKDIVELDVTKYEMNLKAQADFPADEKGVDGSTLTYQLISEQSKIEVLCIFRNDTLVFCYINPIEGAQVFTRPKTDTLNLAKNFLDKYRNESKASYIQPLRDMLNNVSELKSSSITSNDVKLTITTKDNECIEWMEAPNGIHNMYNKVTLVFRNGALQTFSDSWSRYPIGSANVSISEEQAISIAKDRVKSYSYDTNPVVSNLTVNEKSNWKHAELTMQPRGDALYPQWEVYLPLDRVYPGMVTSIHVRLWADTGEITYIHESSVGGAPQEENSNTAETQMPPASSTPINDQTPIQENMETDELAGLEVIAGTAIAAVVIVIVAVAVKKRHH